MSDDEKRANMTSLEAKDEISQALFDTVWKKIEKEFGGNIIFPKRIFWLNGSPGAGKGTHTEFIRNQCNIKAQPIVVSTLLKDPIAQRCKDEGVMVNDEYVTYTIFCKLIDPTYREGIIVDGYPRTKVQADCLKLLYNKISNCCGQNHCLSQKDSKPPCFYIVALFVDEETSIERQLKRGKENQKHNDRVKDLKKGEIKEVRKTDGSIEAARKRYQIFKATTLESLESLKDIFFFHHIDAFGSIEEVQQQITEKLGNL